MTVPSLAKKYSSLTPEERFRLILAASGRGDEAERDRLAHAGGRITLSMPEHAPYAQAFNDVSLLTFMELLDEAASYQEAFAVADNTRDTFDIDETEEESDDTGEGTDAPAHEGPSKRTAKNLFACGLWTSPSLPVTCCGRKPTVGSYSASG